MYGLPAEARHAALPAHERSVGEVDGVEVGDAADGGRLRGGNRQDGRIGDRAPPGRRPGSASSRRPAKIVAPGAGFASVPDWQLSPTLGVNPPIPNSWRREPPVLASAVEDAVDERAVAALDVLSGAARRAHRVAGGAASLVEDRARGRRPGSRWPRSSPSPPRKSLAFVPGKASPSDSAPIEVEVPSSLESLSPKQPTAPTATATPSDTRLAHRICRVIKNLLCGRPRGVGT